MKPFQTDRIVSFGKDAQHLARFAFVDIAERERNDFRGNWRYEHVSLTLRFFRLLAKKIKQDLVFPNRSRKRAEGRTKGGGKQLLLILSLSLYR